MPRVWPGVWSGRIRSDPTLSCSPAAIVPVAEGTSSRSSSWIRTGTAGQCRVSEATPADVIAVMVGQQDQADGVTPRRSAASTSGSSGPSGIDHRRSSARLVKDEVAVGAECGVGGTVQRSSVRPRLRDMGFLHTCYRITDIDRSVAFYRALGFEEVRRMPIRDEAINVFMTIPATATSRDSS